MASNLKQKINDLFIKEGCSMPEIFYYIFLVSGLSAMLYAVLAKKTEQIMKVLLFLASLLLFMVSYENIYCKNAGIPIQFSELKEDWKYKRELPEAIIISTYTENGYSKELKILLPPKGIPKKYFPIGKPFARNGQNLHFPDD